MEVLAKAIRDVADKFEKTALFYADVTEQLY
jgi:hypothetical protein